MTCSNDGQNSQGKSLNHRVVIDREIVSRAHERLSRHAHFRYHLRSIEMDCQEGQLHVEGQLPSFYLKQVLQTALEDVPGVERIHNRVTVVSATGLSSARNN